MTHLQPTSQVETEHGRSRVLVTGGAGFIGSHLVDRLIADGHHVVVVDDLSTGHRSNLQAHVDGPTLTFIEADVGALQRDSDLLGRIGVVTHVVHLAAQTSVVRSVEDPSADFATNASGLFQVIELARQHQSAVVLASSAAVYGNVDVLPVAEDAPAKPLSPYGIHKHLGEHYLRAWSALYGLSTTALRFFNVYGPRQDPKSPYSGVISIFIDRATRGAPLTIFGDGAQTRDFVFVTDVVAAIVAALFRPGATGQIFNVAGGNEVSVKALARRVIDLCGDQSEIVFAEGRSGEIARSLADTRLATDSLGFVPKVALSEGLTQTISWFLDASENPR